jgi:hypothetical protein
VQSGVRGLSPRLDGSSNYGCCWSEVTAVARTPLGLSLTTVGEVSANPGYCNRTHRCNRNIQHGPAIRHDRSIRPLSGGRFGEVGRSGTVPTAGRDAELRLLLVRSDCRRADSAGTVPDYGWRSVRESRVLQSSASVQPQHPAWPPNSALPSHSAACRRAVWCRRAFGDCPRGWPRPGLTGVGGPN